MDANPALGEDALVEGVTGLMNNPDWLKTNFENITPMFIQHIHQTFTLRLRKYGKAREL
jgi:hypothetical protein